MAVRLDAFPHARGCNLCREVQRQLESIASCLGQSLLDLIVDLIGPAKGASLLGAN